MQVWLISELLVTCLYLLTLDELMGDLASVNLQPSTQGT